MRLLKILSLYNFRKWTFPMFLFVLYGFFNYGNYGYLRYDINGNYVSPIINSLVYLRLPICLILASSLAYSSLIYNKDKFLFFKKYWDVLLFFIWIFLISIVNLKLIYPVWFFFAFIGFFKFFSYIKGISYSNIEFIINSLKIVLIAYLFGTFFGLISIPNLVLGSQDIYFSSKTHYTYCVLVVASLILIINLTRGKTNLRLLEWAFILACIILLLYSGRRAPLIVLLINLCIYLLYSRNFIFPIIVAFSTLFINYNLTGLLTFDRINRVNFSNDVMDDSSYNERLSLWDYYVNEVKETDYLGFGLGKINSESKSYETTGTHNTFLSVYYQSGILGLTLWLLIIFRSLFIIFKLTSFKLKIVFMMLFAPFFFISWFENTFNPGQIMFQYNISLIIISRLLKFNYNDTFIHLK